MYPGERPSTWANWLTQNIKSSSEGGSSHPLWTRPICNPKRAKRLIALVYAERVPAARPSLKSSVTILARYTPALPRKWGWVKVGVASPIGTPRTCVEIRPGRFGTNSQHIAGPGQYVRPNRI